MKTQYWIAVLGAIALAALAGLVLIVRQGPTKVTDSYLVVVIAAALVILLAVLLAMGLAFKKAGMADAHEAFGLPQGSIRAVIALFLLLIFVFLDIYLFRTLAEDPGTQPARLTGLTTEEVVALINAGQSVSDVVPSADPAAKTMSVTVQKPGLSTEAKQLATQVVTILGTLTTAVAAFYFGTKAAAEAATPKAPAPGQGQAPTPTPPPSAAPPPATAQVSPPDPLPGPPNEAGQAPTLIAQQAGPAPDAGLARAAVRQGGLKDLRAKP